MIRFLCQKEKNKDRFPRYIKKHSIVSVGDDMKALAISSNRTVWWGYLFARYGFYDLIGVSEMYTHRDEIHGKHANGIHMQSTSKVK